MRNAWAWLAGAAGASALAVAAFMAVPRPDVPAPDAAAAPPDARAEPETAPAPPEVLSLRVEGDGLSVIAGRALPDEDVAILIDGAEVARARAGADGQFATLLLLPVVDDPQVLALLADPEGRAAPSGQEVLIAPQPAPPDRRADTAPAEPAPADEGAALPDPAEAASAVAEPTPADEGAALPEPALSLDRQPERTAPAMAAPDAAAAPAATPPDLPAVPPEVMPVSGDAPAPDAYAPATAAVPDAGALVAARAEPALVAPEAPGLVAAAPALPEADASPAAPLGTAAPATATAPAALAPGPADAAPRGLAGTPAPTGAPLTAAPDLAATAPETGAAPVLALDAQGVRVLGPPPEVPGVPLASVALDVISYDPEGEVSLAGRAGGDGFVRIYLDNASVAATSVMGGRWDVALPDVAPGTYLLRVDQMDAAGAVVSRIESPFLRESVDALAATLAEGARESAGLSVLTVQPGSSLWRIARERYGRGILYVQVFEANRDRIRNPDLIYPGQVFLLPQIDAAAAP